MPNKTTVALTAEQYKEIITTMKEGGAGFRPNERIATALVLEANLGIRISDILELTPKSFVQDGNRYRIDIIEKKTKKERNFKVPAKVYDYIQDYCKKYNIQSNEKLIPYTKRNIQIYLEKVASYLGYENIGTHSFRKYAATNVYESSDYDIMLTQEFLQHSSPLITQRYIGVSSARLERILEDHVLLP